MQQFLLTGFRDDMGFRVFGFEAIGADKTRSAFSVRTDISLIRKHGIHIQELPLVCRRLLELRNEEQETRALTYTEEDMRAHAAKCAADREAAQRNKPKYKQHAVREAQSGATAPSPWR